MGKQNLLGLVAVLGIALFGGCATHYQKSATSNTEEHRQKEINLAKKSFYQEKNPLDAKYEKQLNEICGKHPGLKESILYETKSLDSKILDEIIKKDSINLLSGSDISFEYTPEIVNMIINDIPKIMYGLDNRYNLNGPEEECVENYFDYKYFDSGREEK